MMLVIVAIAVIAVIAVQNCVFFDYFLFVFALVVVATPAKMSLN
jgi:hypothetical protein